MTVPQKAFVILRRSLTRVRVRVMMAFLSLEKRNNEAAFMVLPSCELRGLLEVL